MADEDDADDEDKGISSSRYPCMPSLVALQQMRNRLHLAHLGKKLMKWTAQATVRELRRLGHEIILQYEDFKEEIAEAFILLARSRYYKAMFNRIVLENVPNTACIHVGTTTRSVSGVKLYVLEIIESDEEAYTFLGIEKGGQTINDTKKAWRDLLKKMIYLAELRKSFLDIDYANKSANKRVVMMKKIIIPRIKATIEYILFGLEEMAREDKYRLKMVQQHKKKAEAKLFEERQKALKTPGDESKVDEVIEPEIEKVYTPKRVQSPAKIYVPSPSPVKASPMTIKVPIMDQRPSKVISWNDDILCIKEPEPEPVPVQIPPILPIVCDQCKAMKVKLDNQSSDTKITVLKERLNDIIAQSKEFLETGVKNVNVGQFLKACESVKLQIEDFFKNNAPERGIDDVFKKKLDKLKHNLHDVIGLTREEFEQYTQTFEKMNLDLEINDRLSVTNLEDLDEPPVTQDTKSKLVNLKNEIDFVVKMTASLQENGILAPSVDKFLNTCSSVKSQIDEYTHTKTHTAGDSSLDKLENLSRHVSGLEEIATDIELDGLSSCIIEKFLVSLKEFQSKLDQYKKRENHSLDEGLQKLFTQLDGAIELTKEAKKSGLLSDSVEKFISQCERMKNKLIIPQAKIEGYNDDYDINDTMNKVLNYLTGGNLTDSTENVIKYLEDLAKNENVATTNSKGEIIYPGCSLTCVCSSKGMLSNLSNMSPKSSKNGNADAICDSCQRTMTCTEKHNKNTVKKDLEADKEIRDTSDSTLNPGVSDAPSNTKLNEDDNNEQKTPVYTKIKQITKITRIQGADGTVSEETETITIRKEQIDSTDSSFDGNGENVSSDDTLKDNKENKEVAVCVTPDFAQRGFLRQTRSEYCYRTVPLYNTGFWPCSSVEDFR